MRARSRLRLSEGGSPAAEKLIACLVTTAALAGCASGTSAASGGSASTAAAPAQTATPAQAATPAAAVTTIRAAIRGGKVSPRPQEIRVRQGQRIRIVVTSDIEDEVHVHGYDLEAKAAPGRPATVSFTADQTGVFEVEEHGSDMLLFQLEVR